MSLSTLRLDLFQREIAFNEICKKSLKENNQTDEENLELSESIPALV